MSVCICLSAFRLQKSEYYKNRQNYFNKVMWSILRRSVHKENSHCLQLLLKPDMTYFKDRRGKTVMHKAAEIGSMAACEVILKMRSDAIHDMDKMVRGRVHWLRGPLVEGSIGWGGPLVEGSITYVVEGSIDWLIEGSISWGVHWLRGPLVEGSIDWGGGVHWLRGRPRYFFSSKFISLMLFLQC